MIYCKLRDPGTTFWDPDQRKKISGREVVALEKTQRVRNFIRDGGLIEVSKEDYKRQLDKEDQPEEKKEEEEEKKEVEEDEERYSKSEIEDLFAKARESEKIGKEDGQWVYGGYNLGTSVKKAIEALQNEPGLVDQLAEDVEG